MTRHFAWIWILSATLLWPAGADAQAPDPALVRAQIAAGEFAPALAAARRTAGPQRDAWLAEIAQAQAQAGLRDVSLHTAGEIRDDRSRTQSLARITAIPVGGQGGGPQPDFDALIDLITSTIQPTTWDDVGGPGSVQPFPTGVRIDPQGLLRPLMTEESGNALASLRAKSTPKGGQESVRKTSALRMVSLPRLEKQVQLRMATGRKPTESMLVLAGLQRIQYVFLYPESGDLVVAGPAGDWTTGDEDLLVGVDTGQPCVRLDDLVVILRQMTNNRDGRFGCLITPRPEGLARLKAYVEESNKTPLRPGAAARKVWLQQLRSQVGPQDIEVYGLDPRTRAARVMVEADYRMKLVGMGLEKGVPGVESYLDSIKLGPGEAPPGMSVLRWWFTLNYDSITATRDRQAFAVRGQGVKVESENERLAAEGQRIRTGQSDELNRKFAHSFTEHFDALAAKYPIYAELRNLCDLALVASLIREENLGDRCGWHMTCFGDPQAYAIELGPAPKTVETVANLRVVNQKTLLAGVSGGVRVDPRSLVSRGAVRIDGGPSLASQRAAAQRQNLSSSVWWWD